ncbi:MAG: leucine-rich repeat domain-containing protein, partial [Bacteroidales bacterium]|nr:leucine-rich repeat domain-containing protein [Bacteroidales bacterium]
GCENITEVTIPESVETIGNNAFKGCENLKEVNIPETVTTIGEGTFEGCKNLTEVNIPNGVTTIGENAFAGSGLTTVTIPETVETIGNGAFKGCENLTEVTIPQTITTIGNGTFEGCVNLTDVTIPEGVTTIGENAFAGSGLTNVTIPETVETIGSGAFNGDDLTEIVLTDGTQAITISQDAFGDNCTDVYIGRPVEGTPFAGSSVEHVKIGNTIESIPSGFFAGAENLLEVLLGGKVTEIGDKAFEDCQALKDIVLPPSVINIGSAAFANTGLEHIVIGQNVTHIGDDAFSGVTPESVCITALVPPTMGSHVFTSYSATLRVHDLEIAKAYNAAEGWSLFTDVEELVKASDIVIEGAEKISGTKGEQFTLKATLIGANGAEVTLPHVFWHSTNPEIATVDHNGVVTLKADINGEETVSVASKKAKAAEPAVAIVVESLYANGPTKSFNPVTGETSSIDSVIADYLPEGFDKNSQMEIYDIKGMRIEKNLDELTPGIYIIRQNGHVSKIKR